MADAPGALTGSAPQRALLRRSSADRRRLPAESADRRCASWRHSVDGGLAPADVRPRPATLHTSMSLCTAADVGPRLLSAMSAGGRPPAYLDVRDAAVHYDKQSQRWIWEDDKGAEFEWHGEAPSQEIVDAANTESETTRITRGGWIKVIGDDEVAKQQEIYRVDGVDEHVGVPAH